MTSYVVQPVLAPVIAIPDAELAAYLAAGWTQASAAQLAAWQQADPYAGRQGTPPPPGRVAGLPPAPVTKNPSGWNRS